MARDWFSSGVDAMSKSFGSRDFRQGNPMQGSPLMRPGAGAFGEQSNNPFTQAAISQQRSSIGSIQPAWGGSGRVKDYGNPMVAFSNRAYENALKLQEKWRPQMANPGQSGGAMGQAAATGGKYASMDDTAGEINSAASKFGVPANLVKAIIFRESSGDWGRDGNRYVYLADRGTNINPYSGITDPAAREWGYDPKQLTGNRALQIEAVAKGLSTLYSRVGGQYGWDGVIATYYSGDPTAAYTPADSTQYGTTSQYLSQVKGMWNELDQMSGSAGTYNPNSGPSGATGAASSAWGGGDFPITQGHGMTGFAADVLAGKTQFTGMYDYAQSVGVSGHPGLDVGMPYGTRLFTPAAGTVVVAGGSGYYRDASGDGAGRGEFRLQLDNGDIVILGHLGSIQVAAGQRLPAGAFIGTSGNFNGDHLHYEVRTSTPGATSSGYTAVDPLQYFGGAGSVQQPAQQTPQRTGGLWWQQAAGDLFRR